MINDKNIKTIIAFIIVLIIIIVGGFFIVSNNKKNKSNIDYSKASDTKRVPKKEIDKEYIYYKNEVELSEELQLKFKDVVINIDSTDATNLEQELNNKMDTVRSSLKKQSELNYKEEDTEEETGNDDDIYSVDMIDYEAVESNKYISLTVSEYSYNVVNGISDKKYSYYVFDLTSGNIMQTKDIMKKEDITDQEIRKKIRDYINNDESVDIDLTLNNPYYLTIAKNGTVILNIIVNSNNINYNVSIEMD